MALSPELEQLRDVVKELANIEEVAEYLHLTGKEARGRNNIFISCPFHNEQEGSCVLHPGWDTHFRDFNTWHCFGCGRSGDVVAFWSELRGYSSSGPGFVRAIAELAELFDLAISARIPDWRQIVSGTLPMNALQGVLEFLEKQPVGPVFEISGPAGGTRRLETRQLTRVPEQLRSMLLGPPPDKPVLACPVAEFGAVALLDPKTKGLRGIFSMQDNANFTHLRNQPGVYKGQVLNGKQAPADAPSLLKLALVTENPIDALVLAHARVPVRWGYWSRGSSRRALNSAGNLLSITCVVAVLENADTDTARRFFDAISPGWGLRWIPRYIETHRPTLFGMKLGEVEELGVRAVTESLAPEWAEPF